MNKDDWIHVFCIIFLISITICGVLIIPEYQDRQIFYSSNNDECEGTAVFNCSDNVANICLTTGNCDLYDDCLFIRCDEVVPLGFVGLLE